MTLTIILNMDNAAFTENPDAEAKRILNNLEIDTNDPKYSKILFDANGNKCGKADIIDGI